MTNEDLFIFFGRGLYNSALGCWVVIDHCLLTNFTYLPNLISSFSHFLIFTFLHSLIFHFHIPHFYIPSFFHSHISLISHFPIPSFLQTIKPSPAIDETGFCTSFMAQRRLVSQSDTEVAPAASNTSLATTLF